MLQLYFFVIDPKEFVISPRHFGEVGDFFGAALGGLFEFFVFQ